MKQTQPVPNPGKIVNKKDTHADGSFGGGFYRDRGEGRGVRVARSKITELPVADQADATVRLEKMSASKVPGSFPIGSSPTRYRKTKLAVMGLSSAILDRGDPRYAACIRLANALRKVQSREMYVAHGFVSTSVSALLASSAMALAGARFLYEIAAEADPAQRPSLLKTASSLSDSSRQNTLSAWELCSREAIIHKRNASNNQAVPWMVETASGKEVARAGRPRKIAVALGMAGGNSVGESNAWDNGPSEVGCSISESVQTGQVAGQPSGGPDESGGG